MCLTDSSCVSSGAAGRLTREKCDINTATALKGDSVWSVVLSLNSWWILYVKTWPKIQAVDRISPYPSGVLWLFCSGSEFFLKFMLMDGVCRCRWQLAKNDQSWAFCGSIRAGCPALLFQRWSVFRIWICQPLHIAHCVIICGTPLKMVKWLLFPIVCSGAASVLFYLLFRSSKTFWKCYFLIYHIFTTGSNLSQGVMASKVGQRTHVQLAKHELGLGPLRTEDETLIYRHHFLL